MFVTHIDTVQLQEPSANHSDATVTISAFSFFFCWLVGLLGFVLFCFASQLSSFNPSAQKGGSTLTLLWRLSGYEHPFTFYVLLLLLFCPVVLLVARHLCIVLLWSCTIPVYLKAEHIST